MLSAETIEKKSILNDFKPIEFYEFYVDLQVFDRSIRIYLSSKDESSQRFKDTYSFLKNYMSYFPLKKNSIDYEIFYQFAQNDLSSDSHRLWNDPSYEFYKWEEKEWVNIVQRDFIGKVHSSENKIYALGPYFSEKNPDPIDNLMMASMMRILPPKKALALHCATVEVNNECYVFFGASGAGKSTLAMKSIADHGLRILGGDQVYLQIEHGEIFASPTTTTIYKIPRNAKSWCAEKRKVKGIFHLVQKPGTFELNEISENNFLKFFLKETIMWSEFTLSNHLLEIAMNISMNQTIHKGEVSYHLDEPFWPKLLKRLGEKDLE